MSYEELSAPVGVSVSVSQFAPSLSLVVASSFIWWGGVSVICTRTTRHSAHPSLQREVGALLLHQLLVRALLDGVALVQHDDLVRVADRRQPVRDHHRRARVLRYQVVQCRLYHTLRLVVQRRRRLVE